MNLQGLRALQLGDPVRWHDDETGDVTNGTVQEIITPTEMVDDWDTLLVCVALSDGVPQELYVSELV